MLKLLLGQLIFYYYLPIKQSEIRKMAHQEFNWTTKDGIKIFAKDWQLDKPKAVISLVHGLGEHCVRYNHMADYYAGQGIAMVGYDRRGHGLSEGKKGHTVSFDAYLDEIEQLIVETKKRYPNIPVILYGHSMGGNLALNYILRRKHELTACVATGPWILLDPEPPAIQVSIAKFLQKLFPSLSQNTKLKAEHISRDQKEVDKYINDPLVHDKITLTAATSMMAAANWLLEYREKVPLPTLLMHGSEDQLTSPKGSKAFSSMVKGDLSFKEWNGLFHEIHNEAEQKEVFDYTINWINSKL